MLPLAGKNVYIPSALNGPLFSKNGLVMKYISSAMEKLLQPFQVVLMNLNIVSKQIKSTKSMINFNFKVQQQMKSALQV